MLGSLGNVAIAPLQSSKFGVPNAESHTGAFVFRLGPGRVRSEDGYGWGFCRVESGLDCASDDAKITATMEMETVSCSTAITDEGQEGYIVTQEF